MPLLEVENIHTYYGNIQALKGISLTVEQGEIVSLIGSNGAGKTTTLRSISGLNRVQKGLIRFEGDEIQHLPAHKIACRQVTMVPEGRGVFARLTVQENLEMGAYTRATTRAGRAEMAADLEQQYMLFPRLKDRRKQTAGTLSGGEQQMLAMSRALMAHPRLLLLDEPSMGLAPILVDEVFDLIVRINQENVTILLVEQNALKALSVAGRGYVIQSGEIVLHDSSANLLASEMMQKAYLGGK